MTHEHAGVVNLGGDVDVSRKKYLGGDVDISRKKYLGGDVDISRKQNLFTLSLHCTFYQHIGF